VSDPGRARDYYARAARLDPSDAHGMLLNGWFQREAGQLEAAQAAYTRVIAERGADDEEDFASLLERAIERSSKAREIKGTCEEG
jgi:predicted TPR repeat methyltransferase